MTNADIQALERRLMQTLDMIVMKKKRIALAKQEDQQRAALNKDRGGIWGKLKSMTYSTNTESEYLIPHSENDVQKTLTVVWPCGQDG